MVLRLKNKRSARLEIFPSICNLRKKPTWREARSTVDGQASEARTTHRPSLIQTRTQEQNRTYKNRSIWTSFSPSRVREYYNITGRNSPKYQHERVSFREC